MKFILSFIILFSTSAFAITRFETHCKGSDCFKNGWITTTIDYTLDTVCKKNDCSKNGWNSVANDDSTYNVTCKAGGCFTKGWSSVQKIDELLLKYEVSCLNSNCLTHGWNVKTGYDLMGGNVRCFGNDCSQYGGTSYWRGHPSYTICYENDCYQRLELDRLLD